MDSEIEALGRATGRHVLRLEDLAMGPDGVPCLILQRLSPWSLARLLAVAKPGDGEAVTILAPLALALAELHRVGVAHGRLRAGAVLFDDTGAPVLASFGDAELFGEFPREPGGVCLPPALLAGNAAVLADLEALASVCLLTLQPTTSVATWLTAARDHRLPWSATELADRLFHFANAAPVSFAPARREGMSAPGAAAISSHIRGAGVGNGAGNGVGQTIAVEDGVASRDVAAPSWLNTLGAFLHLPKSTVSSLRASTSRILEQGPVASILRRARETLAPVRKPVWIAAGAVLATVVLAAAVLPSSGNDSAARSAQPSATAVPAVTAPPVPVAALGDEPLAAARALLALRAECFNEHSVLCLDSVNQRNSSAMDADSTQLRLLHDGGARDGSLTLVPTAGGAAVSAPELALVERLGDSALLTVSGPSAEPATGGDALPVTYNLLIVKGDEGWRIRDLTIAVSSEYS